MSRLIFYLVPRVFHLLTFGGWGDEKVCYRYVTRHSYDISQSATCASSKHYFPTLLFAVCKRAQTVDHFLETFINDMQLRKHSEGLKQERGNKAQYVLGGFRYRTFDLCLFCRF